MKRILTLLIVMLTVAQGYAQRDMSERRPIWFGVNMGGTWQTSDMKPVGGIGWGITVSRYSRVSRPGPLYWGWRFRFLDGRNFGYNYHALYGVNTNPVLASYHSNTTPDTGYVFSNYKNRFDEFAFELIVGSNGLRKRGILLYGFGAAGLNYWKTTTDLTNEVDGRYDYSTITKSGDAALVKEQLDGMLDGTYETNANGTTGSGQWSFMPSAGFGFGYQWSNFSIAMEHRTTWALTDLLDGTNHNSAGVSTGNNDIYHYDGLTLKWNFNSHHSTSTTNTPTPPKPDPNQYSNQPQPTPTPQPDPVVNPTPNPTPTPNPIPPVQPPTVQFTTPNVDPYITNVVNQSLVVRVTNVTSSNQISLTINNQASTNFSFNPNTLTMTFTHTLQPGNNVYRVVATNSAGSAQDMQTITFKGNEPAPTALPPQVTITNPPTDPYTSAVQTMTVTATVLNVPTAAGISVTRNGSPITNFNYNPQTQQLSFVANLSAGANLYQVVGTNTQGSASDAVTINYGNANTTPPPVVTITSPAACPHSTKTQAQTITATVTNVTAANQVTVTFNNQPVTNFNFMLHGATATVTFTVNLVPNDNPFTITGTNGVGTNSKSCVITYKPSTPAVVPPDVDITSPNANPFATSNAALTLTATVLNVASASEITVTSNNAIVLGWTYDMNTKVLTYNTTLVQGTTVFKVTAANANGSDMDQTAVVYKVATPAVLPPVVDIITPNTNPYITSVAAQTVIATVLNCTQQNQITVTKLGGVAVPFTFNPTTNKVTFNVTLVPGANQYTVTATNTAGTASDQVTLKFVQESGGAGAETPGGNGNNGGNVGGRPSGNTQVPSPTNPTPTPTPAPSNPSNPDPDPSPSPTPTPNGAAPVVDNLTPSQSSSTTTQQQLVVTFSVLNVTNQSDISVRVNGMPMLTGISFNPQTHQVTFTVTLQSGSNTIKVMAQNQYGSDMKSITVTYNAGGRTSGPDKPAPKEEPKKEEPKKAEAKPAPKEEPRKTTTTPAPAPTPTPAPAPRGTTAPTGVQTRPR